MFCSVITKNSNWTFLTKNLVTFKRKYGVKDEKLKDFWGSHKNLRERERERGELPEKGGLGQFADLRRLGKKDGVVFLMGLIPQCTLQGFPNSGKGQRRVKP